MRFWVGTCLGIAMMSATPAFAQGQMFCHSSAPSPAGQVAAQQDLRPQDGEVVRSVVVWYPDAIAPFAAPTFIAPKLLLEFEMNVDGSPGRLVSSKVSSGRVFRLGERSTISNDKLNWRVTTAAGFSMTQGFTVTGRDRIDAELTPHLVATRVQQVRIEVLGQDAAVLGSASFDLSGESQITDAAVAAKAQNDRRVILYQDKLRNNRGQPNPFMCPD